MTKKREAKKIRFSNSNRSQKLELAAIDVVI